MPIKFLKESEIELGEMQVFSLSKVRCENNYQKFSTIRGQLILTTFKLRFVPILPQRDHIDESQMSMLNDSVFQEESKQKIPSYLDDYLSVPLGLIFRMDKIIQDKTHKIQWYSFIEIHAKDARHMKFIFEDPIVCATASNEIEKYAFCDDKNNLLSG